MRKIAVSFAVKPVLISKSDVGFIAVKLALADGTFGTVLLDRVCAEPLAHLIQQVKQIGWKTDVLRPGPERH